MHYITYDRDRKCNARITFMDNRIDRINGNNYYEYEKVKNIKVSDTGEKFSLDYKNGQLQTEDKDKEDKEESAKEAGQSTLQNGVRLEISNSGRMANAGKKVSGTAAKPKSSATLTEQASSFIESIRTFIMSAITSVKDIFDKIWNEPQPESSMQETDKEEAQISSENIAPTESVNDAYERMTEAVYETPQEAAYAMRRKEELLDREIRPYLKNGDLDQVISLLTDNGQKTIARNSTLLTYYDKNGRMVEPNASDRERILHGDRNARKL